MSPNEALIPKSIFFVTHSPLGDKLSEFVRNGLPNLSPVVSLSLSPYRLLESKILSFEIRNHVQIKDPGGNPLRSGIRNPESGIQYLESGIHGVEFRSVAKTVLLCLTWGETVSLVFCSIDHVTWCNSLSVLKPFCNAFVRKFQLKTCNRAIRI